MKQIIGYSKLKRIIIMCIGIITLMLFQLVACKKGDSGINIPFDISYEERYGWRGEILEIIYTYEEFKTLRNVRVFGNNDTGMASYVDGKCKNFEEKLDEFNETYFVDKALIVYTFEEKSLITMKIDSLKKQGGILIVNTISIKDGGKYFFVCNNFFIEVKKIDIVGITNIRSEIVKQKRTFGC